MFSGGHRRARVNLIGIRIHPALPLIFHVVGGFLGNVATVVALDHAEREIDTRRKSASAGEIAIFNEASTALEVNIGKLPRKISKRRMKRGGGFAGQESGLSQNKRAGADRHRDVSVFGRFTNPYQHRLARLTLGGDNDNLWRGCVGKSVIGYDLHSATGVDRGSRVGDRVETKWAVLLAGNVDVTENFPWPAKVDDDCAV